MLAPARPASAPQSQDFLPYGRQCIDDADVAAVVAALRSDTLTTGPRVEAFETAFAKVVGAPHAVAVANGTAALHLALLTLDLRPGDVCIVPTLTFLATANAVRFAGGEVVFSDVDPDTALMRPQDLEEAIARAGDRRVRAILPVHYAGQMADLSALAKIAARVGAVIIEDACHALGARDAHRTGAGACVDSAMATFSFHPVKTIACGEGGMITTADAITAARLRKLRSHGMERDLDAFVDPTLARDEDGERATWAYEMPALGYNYRLTDIQCALGLSQLAKLDRFLERRRALVARYHEALAALGPHVIAQPIEPGVPGWHLMVALIDYSAVGRSRSIVMRELRARGIGSQVHYIPVHRQPYYAQRYGPLDLDGAERFYRRCLSLPLFPTMLDTDVDHVVSALGAALGR